MRFQTNHGILYHLHIPRTAGRYVGNNIALSGHECIDNRLFPLRHVSLTNAYQCEYMHLEYDLCVKYIDNFSEMKKFTVVREHWERFNSAIKHCIPFITKYGFNLEELEDYDRFVWYMEEFEFFYNYSTKGFINSFSGWFRPNYNWLREDVDVWYYKDGFNQNFAEWLFYNYSVEFNLQNIIYHDKNPKGDGKIILSTKMIDNIEYYYKHREISYAI